MLRLTPHERIFVWRLTEGRHVSTMEMIGAFYKNHPDGGALWAQECVRQVCYRVRNKMQMHGIEVRNHHGAGWFVARPQIDALRDLLADEIRRNVPSDGRRWHRKSRALSDVRAVA